MIDPSLQAALLENLDVKTFLDNLNGLLTGQKKLIIESKPAGNFQQGPVGYTHTFKVKDTNQ